MQATEYYVVRSFYGNGPSSVGELSTFCPIKIRKLKKHIACIKRIRIMYVKRMETYRMYSYLAAGMVLCASCILELCCCKWHGPGR